MKNRMQDLDFEQNVAFDKVQEYEFTRRAAQRFRQVVSLDSFEDEDADVIFHYLYKEMELVSFGDHLKRYIYERAELEEPFSEVPQEVLYPYCTSISVQFLFPSLSRSMLFTSCYRKQKCIFIITVKILHSSLPAHNVLVL